MPAELVSKQQRQEMILEIVKSKEVHNQLELIRFLEERGITATQSSVSRDIHDLSIAKVDGRYVVAVLPVTNDGAYGEPVDNPGNAFVTSLVPSGPNLLVVKTLPGGARSVGRSIDKARWPEVLGLVASDETLFIATNEKRDQLRLMTRLQQFMENHEPAHHEEPGLPSFARPGGVR
ncbi:MAG: arginine repressor [Planctomycetota bacterium]